MVAGVLVVSGCGHPWFESRWSREESPDADQQPVITNSERQIYHPGTPSWVPLIDECMNAGGGRGECIAALPPEELAKLEAWEAERGRMRRSRMALRRALNAPAESLAFGFFEIDLPPGWLTRVEEPGTGGWSDEIVATHAAGIGTLRMRSLRVPNPVTPEQLRNLTNVDVSVAMPFEPWGEYQGYQYDYLEGDHFLRHWWLARGNTIVMVNYQCPAEYQEVETAHIDEIVRSLRAVAR